MSQGAVGSEIAVASTNAPRLNVTDWRRSTAPKLNGERLPLEEREISYALAVAPDAEAFALGTGWFVRFFNRSGKERWNVPAPDVTRAINISGNGRFVVAAFGDGTIRWYRIEDGKELLAFFPHNDRQRWVLWTPLGYYDASPGGENLIGWHVNRGADQAADFFPASRFRDTFYRPDVIAKVLETRDEAKALQLANAAAGRKQEKAAVAALLPPVVELVAPADGTSVSTSPITIRFRVRAPADAPATSLRVRVNGQLVSLTNINQALGEAGEVKELAVPIQPQDSEIALFAQNRHAWSEPAMTRVTWQGAKSKTAPRAVLYVLAIGVGKYKNPDLELEFAANDARDFVETIRKQTGALYKDVVVQLLTDTDATRAAISKGLTWLRKEVTAQDLAMLFFSGHGKDDADGRYYFLPSDMEEDNLLATGVAKDDFTHITSGLAGKWIFFADACHAGKMAESERRKGPADFSRLINELSSAENGGVVYASSTGRQFSQEGSKWQNGAFTKALVEGLSGQAAESGNHQITHQMLGFYLSKRVKELTEGRQHPVPGNPGTADFPIAVVR